MANIRVPFVKYYNEAINNAYISFPQRIINLFGKDLYAKLIIADQGDLKWSFIDDGSGNYVSGTEYKLGLIKAHDEITTQVYLSGSLPSETSQHTFNLRIELYSDDQYTKLFTKDLNTIIVDTYIQKEDGTWDSSTKTGVVYKVLDEKINEITTSKTKYGGILHLTVTQKSLYIDFAPYINWSYDGITLALQSSNSPLGVYPAVEGLRLSGNNKNWKGALTIQDYINNQPAPFKNKYVAMTVENQTSQNNVEAGVGSSGVPVPAGKKVKIVSYIVSGFVGIRANDFVSDTNPILIGDFVVFNPL